MKQIAILAFLSLFSLLAFAQTDNFGYLNYVNPRGSYSAQQLYGPQYGTDYYNSTYNFAAGRGNLGDVSVLSSFSYPYTYYANSGLPQYGSYYGNSNYYGRSNYYAPYNYGGYYNYLYGYPSSYYSYDYSRRYSNYPVVVNNYCHYDSFGIYIC